ncbi:NADH-ubiquinone oxidoreductase chain E [Sinorhizobium sojae CCBAU 05684]|uniref:NADH-ubiquinone oxidoreductase chain E n=1 Tax=Sinorhizobium sojae CCBAU 05684 TaxID=716928 RepID=A0A249P9H7_9HYPH|nr:helix-hairpin-helix domain-containing protein [Sinorhizobium sojae]ASY62392.1 NADH-ubiquinone oxidoreductase chain E [Sinorhizobium sojae CCBAU 05684]
MARESKEAQGRETATVIPFVRSVGVDLADPFGMSEWMKSMPQMPLHPLMTHPAAAVAAATALGFGLSSHFAGMMFGAMQGAASVLQGGVSRPESRRAAEPSASAPARPAKEPPATSVKALPEPAKASPVSAKAPTLPKAEASPTAAAPAAARKPKAPGKQATSAPRSRAVDDLKRISGVGPKLEQVLNGKGIRQLADIAALSAEDVARLDAEFGLDGRIARDDWVGQAKALMKKK